MSCSCRFVFVWFVLLTLWKKRLARLVRKGEEIMSHRILVRLYAFFYIIYFFGIVAFGSHAK